MHIPFEKKVKKEIKWIKITFGLWQIWVNQGTRADAFTAKYLPEFKNAFNKPFISVVWIEGFKDDECVLEEKGMSDFPYIIFHWYRKTNTSYTMGLGHDILGDVKELQALERDTKRARAKKINPPLRADPSLKNAGIRVGSDDITYTNNKEGVTPLYNVNFDTVEGENSIAAKDKRSVELVFSE